MSTEPSAPHPDSAWSPLLTGEDADRAREALAQVAGELSEWTSRPQGGTTGIRAPSLAGGDAGVGLFYAYLALATEDETEADRWADEAVRLLDRAAEALSTTVTPPELYSGFSGVAWTLEHLDGRLFENEGDGQEAIDEVLLDYLDSEAASGEFDIIQGLTGFGVYALERGSRPSARRCLEKVIRRLGATATCDADGVRWFSAPERMPEHQRVQNPDGHFNAGTAHGLPGVLPVLAGAAAAGVAESEARELLEGGVAWMLSRRLPFDQPGEDHGCHLPYSWKPDGEPGGPARHAWCYGDPGAGAALLCAARRVGRADWADEAVRMLLDAAARPVDRSGIQDGGLCHGAAGLGLIFHRAYAVRGNDRLAEAARFWYRWTLDLRDRILSGDGETGIAGFPAWASETGNPGSELDWRKDAGFLTGSAGIGLALLSALTGHEPAWDRVLGLSIASS